MKNSKSRIKTALTLEEIAEVEEILGYHFKNPGWLNQAFLRTSLCNEAKQAGIRNLQSNEVLEFCGDSILGAAIATLLMERCASDTDGCLRTALDQGDFSVIKSNLSDKTMLSTRAGELGLGRYLLMGRGDHAQKADRERSVLEDLFESLVAAVYFDSGKDFSATTAYVGRLLDLDHFLTARPTGNASPRNELQERCAKFDLTDLDEHKDEIVKEGPEHDPVFTARFTVGEYEALGRGHNTAEAQANAAAALCLLLDKAEREGRLTVPVLYTGSPKNELQEYCQKYGLPAPVYHTVELQNGRFAATCTITDGTKGEGSARRKKDAEQIAAADLLSRLKKG